MRRLIILLLIISFAICSITYTKDFNIGINYYGYSSNNILMNSSEINDFISSLSIDLNYTKEDFNFYLEGLSNIYTKNSEYNSLKIEPGFEYLKYLKGRNYLYFNLAYSVLDYKEYFTDFNYNGPLIRIGTKFYLKPDLLFKAGYNFQYRMYSNFSSFDFSNHTVFLELDKFFSSQISLRMQSGLNYRLYPHIKNYDDNNMDTGIVNSFNVPNIFGLFRISKGFGTKTGVFFESVLRKNFTGLKDAETLIQNSYVVYPYNDNYLWDGEKFSLGIKFIPFEEIAVSGTISYYNKSYPGIFVFGDNGEVALPEVEREDSLYEISLKITKKIDKLDVFLNSVYKNNISNDSYFKYKSFALSIGIGYYF